MHLIFTTMLMAFAVAQKPLDPNFTDVFGPPPGLETGSDLYKQQLVEIFGPLPSIAPGSDALKQELFKIYGHLPNNEPIDELTLPPAVWLNIFGSDENEITEIAQNTSPYPNVASKINSEATSPEITRSVTTRFEITSPKSQTPVPSAIQNVTVDPILQAQIEEIFKTPNENILVTPTESPATFVGSDGAPCKCVPYYLCDQDHNGVYINNASVTGYGELDIRFGEGEKVTRKCQESVELCCKVPKDTETVTMPPETPKLRGCGYRNPKGVDFTITGGSGGEAQYGEFPWVVALVDVSNGSLVGVGAIIHPQVIITGAHIASKYSPGTLRIRAGEWDTSTIKERLPYQEREIQEIYNHFDFHPKSLRNDMALIRLSQPLKLDEHINMICLPDQDESFDTSVGCIANGWGKDVFGLKGRYAVILKKVELNMVPYSRCSSQLRKTRLGPHFVLHSNFLCAGGEEGKDTCSGDGGAPLACPLGDDRYTLTGITAWGIGCGVKDVPAVYAGVSNYKTLIDDKMNDWGYGTTTYSI